MKEQPSGIYIHFPFCRSRCGYCGFCTVTNTSSMRTYYEYLLTEIDAVSLHFEDVFTPFDTIYFGGGTPSLMEADMVEGLLSRIRTSFSSAVDWERIEITLEANPEDLQTDFLNRLVSVGINRLSVGAQRFDDTKLKFLGRRHSVKDTMEGVVRARKAGFGNISIDLIFGLPADDLKKAEEEFEPLISLEPDHLSVYLLEIKDNTPFAQLDPGIFPLNDRMAELYKHIIDLCSSSGFEQYEISNFAKEGKISRHNMKYWSGVPWVGLGVSASSYSGKARWTNPDTLEQYFDLVKSNNLIIPPGNAQTDRRCLAEEAFFMGMRKVEGIELAEFINRWGFDILGRKSDFVNSLVESKLAKLGRGRFCLTKRGFLLSNEIFSEFITAETE